MADYIIKRISTNDPEFAQVLAIREEVLRRPLGLSLHDEDLSEENAEETFIALQKDSVIGCVMLRPVPGGLLKLRQMAVAEDHQGRGIGAALVQAAEDYALAGGYAGITLHARITAVPFYERLGYRAGGNVFSEVGIPHLLMQKQVS
jgi:predicted N-acetyltransferase YhbS